MAQGFGSLGDSFGGPRRSRRRRRKHSAVRRYAAAASGAAVVVAVLVGIAGWSDRASAVLDGIGMPGGRLAATGETRRDAAPRPDAAQDVARSGAPSGEAPDGASGGDPAAPGALGEAAEAPAAVPAGDDAPVATAPATEASPPVANGTEGTSTARWATAARGAGHAAASPMASAGRVFLQLSSFNDKKRAD